MLTAEVRPIRVTLADARAAFAFAEAGAARRTCSQRSTRQLGVSPLTVPESLCGARNLLLISALAAIEQHC